MTRAASLGQLTPATHHPTRRIDGPRPPAIPVPDLGPDAACADPAVDPEWFFPPSTPTGQSPAAAKLEAQAKAVCMRCPSTIMAKCLVWALEAGVPGVWGGLGEGERKHLHTKRRAS